MTINLNSLDRWKVLPAGKAVLFDRPDAQRRARINFNCAAQTVLHVEDANGPRLLTSVPPGLSTVQFSVKGAFAIMTDKGSGEVHYQTADIEPTSHQAVDEKVFTKLATRRQRNPELEAIMHQLTLNQQRMFEQQREEYEFRLAQMEKARNEQQIEENAPAAPEPPAAQVPAQEQAEPEPKPDSGSADAS
jgi:hypothetical protein